MPLQKQSFALQFSGGIETKQDAKQVPVARLLNLENATFIKATTLAKRNGYRALGRTNDKTVAQLANPVGLAERDGELLLFDGSHAYSHRDSSDSWNDTGEIASIVASEDVLARTGTQQTMPDHATNAGITVLAWEDHRGGVWLSVVEASTHRILLSDHQLDAAATSPRCVACGNFLHVYYATPATGRLWVAVVSTVRPGDVPAPAILTEDLSLLTPTYDAVTAGGTTYASIGPALIAWTIASGYRVGYVAPSGALGTAVTGLPTVATYNGVNDENDGAIACAYERTTDAAIAVVWNDPSGTLRARFSPVNHPETTSYSGLVSEPMDTWTRISCELLPPDATGSAVLWWVGEAPNGTTRIDLHTVTCSAVHANGATLADASGNAFTSTTRHLLGHALLSRAFIDNGAVYAAVVHPVQFFPYVAIARVSANAFGGAAGTPCMARLEAGSSTGAPTRAHVTSTPPITPSSVGLSRQHALTIGYRIQLSSEHGDQFGEQGIKLTTLDFASGTSYGSAQLGRGTYLGGAVMMHYDGRRWAEADFHCAPDVALGAPTIATPTGAAGGAMALGTYGYKFCYEEIDAQGELHPGPTSVLLTAIVGGGQNAISFQIPTCRLTGKTMVRIGVFRTTANPIGNPDQLEFLRVTSIDPSVATGNNRYVANDPTTNTVTFIDGMDDLTLLTKEPLYTNGGILSNDPPPTAGQVIAGGKSRLFWSDPTDPHVVRFSQQLRDDTAIEMSAALSMRTDPYGGKIVGLAVMDGGVFAFKDTAIYVADGPGPDADGGTTNPSNAFTPFSLVTSDVGCKSAGSICQTPDGIVFQSTKGIKLLGRDRQVTDIGAPVYAFNAQTFVRATLLPDRHQVVFLTSSGFTLLWDYERNQWSKFTNHEGVDAAVANGTYCYLRNDGRVFAETPGICKDDNQHIRMVIETAWIKMVGFLQGWQKVLYAAVIGTYKSSHQLLARYRLNYQEAYRTLPPIDVDSKYTPSLYGAGSYGVGSYGGAGGPTTVYQEQIHINKRCQAISFRFEDVESTNTFGAAFELSELLLTGGAIGTKFPMGAARSH